MITETVLCNERLPGESFDTYKRRLRAINFEVKKWLRGRVIWNSLELGTYKRGAK